MSNATRSGLRLSDYSVALTPGNDRGEVRPLEPLGDVTYRRFASDPTNPAPSAPVFTATIPAYPRS